MNASLILHRERFGDVHEAGSKLQQGLVPEQLQRRSHMMKLQEQKLMEQKLQELKLLVTRQQELKRAEPRQMIGSSRESRCNHNLIELEPLSTR